jgi:hypothetical protein
MPPLETNNGNDVGRTESRSAKQLQDKVKEAVLSDDVCKTCKFWYSFDTGWGSCERAKGSGGGPMHHDTKMYASDVESYAAQLFTSENFGCVEHANKSDS